MWGIFPCLCYGTVVDWSIACFTVTSPPSAFVCSLLLLLKQIILHGAALDGDAMMVTALIKAGAACSGGRDSDGMTPLHAAAQGGRYVDQ